MESQVFLCALRIFLTDSRKSDLVSDLVESAKIFSQKKVVLLTYFSFPFFASLPDRKPLHDVNCFFSLSDKI